MKADPSDLEDLAGRYMVLWQEQLAGMACDPKATEAVARVIELMTAGWATFALLAQDRGNGTGTPGEAAAPGVTRGNGDGDMAELPRRISELEERVAALEAKPGSSDRRTGSQSRRRPT